MNSFKDFKIKPVSIAFEGDKIKIDRILNRQIIIEKFKIDKSNFDKGTGKRLTLQINLDNTKRIVFSGSGNLMDMITQVPENGFPFQTTIIKENERFQFT